MKGISIILCCYNSANRLPETIRYIAAQQVPYKIMWEVILVNNASIDDTVIVARKEWDKYHCNADFRIVDQPIPGLSSARKKGIEESKFGYLLFCDDDNWLNSDYIRLGFEIMETNSSIGVLGGQTMGVYEGTPPKWFLQRGEFFAIGKQALASGDVSKSRGFVWGAASIYRRKAFLIIEQLGINPVLHDRKGKKMSTGGDVEFCYMIRELGYKIWYDERLVAKHYMTNNRYSIKKFHKLNQANGILYYLVEEVYTKNEKVNNWFFIYFCKNSIDLILYKLLGRNYENLSISQQTLLGMVKGWIFLRGKHKKSESNKRKLIEVFSKGSFFMN